MESSSGKYLIWDTNSLFGPALSSVHETYPSSAGVSHYLPQRLSVPKAVLSSTRNEKDPSLENAATTPMFVDKSTFTLNDVHLTLHIL